LADFSARTLATLQHEGVSDEMIARLQAHEGRPAAPPEGDDRVEPALANMLRHGISEETAQRVILDVTTGEISGIEPLAHRATRIKSEQLGQERAASAERSFRYRNKDREAYNKDHAAYEATWRAHAASKVS
jgi:hypothetical protein